MWDGKELVVDLTVTGFTMPRFIPGIPKINFLTNTKTPQKKFMSIGTRSFILASQILIAYYAKFKINLAINFSNQVPLQKFRVKINSTG